MIDYTDDNHCEDCDEALGHNECGGERVYRVDRKDIWRCGACFVETYRTRMVVK